ncbi:hypothetical protein [Rubrivivax gelatinosus]|uniref:Uncharacterized protein n=1 Tax=Rubrivivax gelatinosus TaxID=28068 RepID=A0ABS1DXV3_RUBGE|nr:hypothetical protein [Rubrivivax gelatinosus]MBK1714641.1 hypothetical protein [Rubrivivax gelatinosus]
MPLDVLRRAERLAGAAGAHALRLELAALLSRHRPRPAVRWAWLDATTHTLDGQQVHATTKALPLAFLLLLGFRHGVDPLPVAAVFPSASAALQALDRAARAAGRFSPAIEACVRSIGVRSGVFVLRAALPADLDLDPAALRQALGVNAA